MATIQKPRINRNKLLDKKAKRPVKTKGRKRVRASKAARYPLSNEQLERLGAKHEPAASWYDEPELP